jgi:hypothetical protein
MHIMHLVTDKRGKTCKLATDQCAMQCSYPGVVVALEIAAPLGEGTEDFIFNDYRLFARKNAENLEQNVLDV